MRCWDFDAAAPCCHSVLRNPSQRPCRVLPRLVARSMYPADRAHRIGQASSVNVMFLHVKGSIDDIIWQARLAIQPNGRP